MPPRRGSPSSRRTMRGLVSMASATRATLVFDGDCAICRSWVSYWQRLTNGRVISELSLVLSVVLIRVLSSCIEKIKSPLPQREKHLYCTLHLIGMVQQFS